MSLNDQVTALFAAQPGFGDNPVGTAARAALINRLKGAMPGAHTRPWPLSASPPFIDIFYPSWSAGPSYQIVSSQMGQSDGWWSDFSVVAVCQVMYYVTSDIRSQLKQPNIDNEVANRNATLRPKLNNLYTALLTGLSSSPVATPFNQIAGGDRAAAAQIYKGFLSSPAWISAKVAQYSSGQWTNQVWELLHHWFKLFALGMSPGDIDGLIRTLKAAQLPVPDSVGPTAWETATPWMSPAALSWQDLTQANPGILARVCTVYPGSMFPSCMNEENSYEFTANSQPGSGWRSPPGGSCFLPDTRVLMADGSMKPIQSVGVHDVVKTRAGSAPVMATVTLQHAGETVYSLDDFKFSFTGTHPFFTINDQTGSGARLACADPIALMNTVPTLSSFGVAPLGPNCPPLAGYQQGKVNPLPIKTLIEHPVTPGATTIYDLVVDFDAEGLSEYIAGDGQTMIVVSSEVPRHGVAPDATYALTDLMTASWPTVQAAMRAAPPDRWLDILYQGLNIVSTDLLATAIRGVQGAPTPAPSPKPPLQALARSMASRLMTVSAAGDPVYDAAQGAYFAALMAVFGDEFNDAISLGWRLFTTVENDWATLLAVSALSVEFVGSEALPTQTPIAANMTLGTGALGASRSLGSFGPLGSSNYYAQLGATVYFDNWRATPGQDVWITIALSSNGAPLNVSGAAVIPGVVDNGYRLFNAPLLDAAGAVLGQFSFDARPFSPVLMSQETAAAHGWTPAAQTAFAHALGAAAAPYLNQRFPDAVKPLINPQG